MMRTQIINSWIRAALAGLLFAMTAPVHGQPVDYDLVRMLADERLEQVNRLILPLAENNRNGIRFNNGSGEGIAWLKDVILSNGIIEVDIRGKNIFQKSFVGVAFHGLNNETYDAVYFRPFNFQSDDPVRKAHAVQYISHPDYPWAVLREKYSGKYENEVSPAPDGDDWFHATIIIDNPQVTVYVNNNTEPCLRVDKLASSESGIIGLWVGNGSDGDFANLKVTAKK